MRELLLSAENFCKQQRLASTVGNALNSYSRGRQIVPLSGFVNETCLLRRDAMVGGWGDPAYVRPSSTKLGGGLKPGTLTFNW